MIAQIINLKKVWIVFLIALIASFIMAGAAKAEEDTAKKYNVTFPVAELGNCGNISDCRSFCEDPLNQNACIDFAKKKGFYKEPKVAGGKKEEIIAAAKKELGCETESACRSLCSDQANFDKCAAFAKKQGLPGGSDEGVAKGKILEKAKEILGCNSSDSCASFCSKEENRQKCSEFAKETGLRGGEQRVGPGGCTSEETCKAFCSDPQNFQVCQGFSESAGSRFSGPGGCNSEQSCQDYCKSNPDSCRNFAAQSSSGDTYKKYCDENPGKCRQDKEDKREFEKFCLKNPEKCRETENERRERGYDPQEMCSKTPNCKWEENTCRCGSYGGPVDDRQKAEEYAKLCRENPDKCRPGQRGGFDNEKDRKDAETMYPRPYATSYSGSSGAPSTTTGGTMDPATGCRNAGGSWNGNYCQMPGTSPTPPQKRQPAPAPAQESQPAPAPAQESQPAPVPAAPVTEPAPAPAVQGITAVRNIFDRILDFFR